MAGHPPAGGHRALFSPHCTAWQRRARAWCMPHSIMAGIDTRGVACQAVNALLGRKARCWTRCTSAPRIFSRTWADGAARGFWSLLQCTIAGRPMAASAHGCDCNPTRPRPAGMTTRCTSVMPTRAPSGLSRKICLTPEQIEWMSWRAARQITAAPKPHASACPATRHPLVPRGPTHGMYSPQRPAGRHQRSWIFHIGDHGTVLHPDPGRPGRRVIKIRGAPRAKYACRHPLRPRTPRMAPAFAGSTRGQSAAWCWNLRQPEAARRPVGACPRGRRLRALHGGPRPLPQLKLSTRLRAVNPALCVLQPLRVRARGRYAGMAAYERHASGSLRPARLQRKCWASLPILWPAVVAEQGLPDSPAPTPSWRHCCNRERGGPGPGGDVSHEFETAWRPFMLESTWAASLFTVPHGPPRLCTCSRRHAAPTPRGDGFIFACWSSNRQSSGQGLHTPGGRGRDLGAHPALLLHCQQAVPHVEAWWQVPWPRRSPCTKPHIVCWKRLPPIVFLPWP
ncbi:hypothetical protein FQR65_LT20372 [Abscondita terminalis]|nr:hypothetical protein FQR65_LT20372 [Abscondita terminalis]